MGRSVDEPIAYLGGRWARDLVEVSDDPEVLDRSGRWAVVLPYQGRPILLRFARWQVDPPSDRADLDLRSWSGPPVQSWQSSVSQEGYLQAVNSTREAIAVGTIYQANICRILAAEMTSSTTSMAGLHARLAAGNPAPYGGFISAPEIGVELATASPELFLEREGDLLRTGPIKGTASTEDLLLPKDWAENVMIVDLMRNDLGRICQTGTVTVPALTMVERHPGLVHLVSRVEGMLTGSTTWSAIIESTFPPGSVTGAPKSAALRVIEDLEAASREIYCGAVGWVDADRQQACLAVAIRTFWYRDGLLRFGTGAGITWDSDPEQEWRETQLKARHLIAVAAGADGAAMAGFDV